MTTPAQSSGSNSEDPMVVKIEEERRVTEGYPSSLVEGPYIKESIEQQKGVSPRLFHLFIYLFMFIFIFLVKILLYD